MDTSTHHDMQLLTTHASGAEEWFCPTCGRRFLMHWPPTYRKIVLERGDEGAIHRGGHSAPVAALPHADAPAIIDPQADEPMDFGDPEQSNGLGPWRKLLDGMDS